MEPLPDFGDATPARLTPSMASFKVLVLSFTTEFIIRNRISPTQGEIAAGLATYRSRVRDAIRRLVAEGLLLKTPGERGLALPDEKDKAVRTLLRHGWELHDGVLRAPGTHSPISTLPAMIELDYP